MKTELQLHPLCTLFPRLSGTEFESLKNDIRANGLREPIIIHDGMILDGGNRYRACLEIGVDPGVMKFGGGNLVSYVISANLHRRHLTPGQQAAIVASAQDWGEAQVRGGDRKSNQSQAVDFDSVKKRSAVSGASRVTQMKADKLAKTDPELAKKVGLGEISLPKAIKSITPKKEEPHEDADYDPKEGELQEANDTIKDLAEQNTNNDNESEEQLREELYGGSDPQLEIEKAHKEIDQLTLIIESDDKLVAAMAEIKRLNALIEVIESQKIGFQSSENAAKRAAKMWKSKFEKLERSVKASGLVDF
jgi:hypothetical protein